MEYWAGRATGHVMRELSKAAFGQELRLALCLFVARLDEDYFTLGLASSSLGVTASALQAPLGSLLNIEVVRRLPPSPSRSKWLARQPSTLWPWVEELFADDADQLTIEFGPA